MKKLVKTRTKIEAIIAFSVVTCLIISSAFAINIKFGTDSDGDTWSLSYGENSLWSVWKEGSTYYGKNCSNGSIISNTDFDVLINYIDQTIANTGGGKIYLQGGTRYVTYTYDSDIELKQNVYLIGSGTRGIELSPEDNATIHINKGGSGGTLYKYGGIQHIRFLGPSGISGTAIIVENVTHYDIKSCIFKNFDTCIQMLGDSNFGRIEHNLFHDYHDYAIDLKKNGGFNPNICWIKNNEFQAGTGAAPDTKAEAAINAEYAGNMVISDNYFEDTTGYVNHWMVLKGHSWRVTNSKIGAGASNASIYIEADTGESSIEAGVIHACKIFGDKGDSIFINTINRTDREWVTITDSTLYGTGTIGLEDKSNCSLFIDGCVFDSSGTTSKTMLELVYEDNIVSNNRFYLDDAQNIITMNCNHSVVANNVFSGSYGDYSIDIAANANDNRILDNVYRGYSSSAVNDAGTENVVIDFASEDITFGDSDFFKFDLSGTVSQMAGGTTSGDDIAIFANQADSYPKIALNGNNYMQLIFGSGKYLRIDETTNNIFKFTDNSDTISEFYGSDDPGDDLHIYRNSADNVPVIYMNDSGVKITDLVVPTGEPNILVEGSIWVNSNETIGYYVNGAKHYAGPN